ncbi:MAG: hypothetical protein E7677_02565 [Ruminococcaceae bacterium]|nr:hypothetical protein [Oscillospiraceae bacterium]
MKTRKPRKRHRFFEAVCDILHIIWFTIYHLGKALRYLFRAPIRALKCKIGYYKSPFYQVTGIKKETFYRGSSWAIGNDQRYIVCNAISRMKLPLETISVENPCNKEESLMYYHIYKDTIIVTHGFYQATIWDDGLYRIKRNHHIDPEEYGTAYSVSEFAKMYWMQYICPEHKDFPIKVLHSNKRYRFQWRRADTYDLSPNGIFYRRLRNLKKIFR